MKWIKAIKL